MKGSNVMTAHAKEQTAETVSQGLGRSLYPMRLLGTLACITIAAVYVSNFAELRLGYIPFFIFITNFIS